MLIENICRFSMVELKDNNGSEDTKPFSDAKGKKDEHH